MGKKLSVGFGGGGVSLFLILAVLSVILPGSCYNRLESNLLSQYQCVFFLP